jgi:signal transduction histidine kinase
VHVTLDYGPDALRMIVEDDGHGFFQNPEHADGMGLRTMAYRARLIGAVLELSERDGPVTCLRCEMPLHGSTSAAAV